MKSGYQPTVTFPLELAPTIEARDVAHAAFEKQTGVPPDKLFTDEQLGLWGWLGRDAVLLFRIPQDDT